MNDSDIFGLSEQSRRFENGTDPHGRAVGSPLPTGAGGTPLSSFGESPRLTAVPPHGRALTNASSSAQVDVASAIQRAIGALRAAFPYVQKVLPLLEGNILSAVSNLMTPHPQPPPPPPPPVNLVPIERGLAELQTQHTELRDQVAEQNSSLKRVEDQLEMVREATDRNTLEQQELIEDLKGVGNKVKLFSLIALGLLAVSVVINVVLYLHIIKVLP
jgi:hypothetical protein